MNPIRWVRWKVVIVLGVLGGVFYYLGLDTIALKEVNSAGRGNAAARWSIKDLGLGLLMADLNIEELLVGTPQRADSKPKEAAVPQGEGAALTPEEKVFNALGAKFDLSMLDLLKRRFVVDKVGLQAPKISLTRREDGSINIEEIGAPPEEEKPETASKPEDWLGSAKKWYERIKKVREKVSRPGQKPREKKPGEGVDYSRGVSYPFEVRPGFLVHEIEGSGLEIEFSDAKAPSPLPPLKNGRIVVSEVSSSPTVQEKETTFEVSGEIAGAPLSVKGTVDLRKVAAGFFDLAAQSGDLPASVVEAFIAPSLPVKLKAGTIAFDSRVFLAADDRLELAPKLIFKKLQLEAKDPRGKVAGLDATQFVTAFNEASSELEAFVLDDLKITGTLFSPRFEWGNTVKDLVLSGGTAFAQKYANKFIEKSKGQLEKEAGKVLDKVPVGGELKEKLKGATKELPGGEKVKEGLDSLKKGLFGGPQEEPPKEDEKKN